MDMSSLKKKIKENRIIYNIYSHTVRDLIEKRRVQFAKKELQENGKELIERIGKSLEKNDIEYFVNFGSLLGIIRDGKFMSFDHDIDFGIIDKDLFSWEEFELLIEKCGGKKTKQFKLDGQITEQSYRFLHIDIDFFKCTLMNNKTIQYLYYKDTNTIYKNNLEYSVGQFCAAAINGIEKKQIGEMVFSIPKNSEEYLESIYSKNWRIPDPNWNHLKGPSMYLLSDKKGYAEYFI